MMDAAVIGAGRMGRRHIQVVRSLGLALAGVCDVAPEALQLAQTEQGVPPERCFTDVASLLHTRPDVVIVATTAPTHCDYTCQAAEAGAQYILCEKPMALSLAECDRMIATCQQHGAKLAINHQMRFMEQYTLPRQLITDEAFGGLGSVTVVAGNFGMAMNGSHYVEMFRYITGEAPIQAQAWFSDDIVPNPRGTQFEDRAGCLRLLTASGKRFYMDISSDQGHGMHVTYAGRNGRIDVDELSGALTLVQRLPEHRAMPTTRYGMPYETRTLAITPADAVAPSAAVLRALLAEADYPDGAAGRLAVATLVAAYLSHEQGAPIAVDAALPADRVFPWA